MAKNKTFWRTITGVFVLVMLFGQSCVSERKHINTNYQEDAANADFVHRSVKAITNVIVHDIFSPPVASRIYSYSCLAGYEALAPGFPEYQSLEGRINELENVPKPEAGQEYCFPLASVHALLTVGKTLIFSEEKIEAFEKEIYGEFQALNMPPDVYERSMAFGKAISNHILEWSKHDNYKQSRTFPKYSITDDPAKWKPTPPDYMDGIEPHWMKIRPLALDSAQQFSPPPPTPYSMDKNSQFYKEAMEVYEALRVGEEEEIAERREIASFWDCNPYVSHHKGHVMFATKKITPGGHWMGIAQIAAKKANSNMMETMATYTYTAVALFDGFISCWDEKYRSNLVRPETVINAFVDEDWTPALQTPPFPEYTSGHSVISRAAATVLTEIYGDNFSFVDSTEAEYGLPIRSFTSFLNAANEAAISRLYAGIHYRPAIENGMKQGEKVGNQVIERLGLSSRSLGMKTEK